MPDPVTASAASYIVPAVASLFSGAISGIDGAGTSGAMQHKLYNKTAWSSYTGLEKIMPYLQMLMKGKQSPFSQQYMQSARNNLFNSQGVALNSASQNAGTYAASRGMNPYALTQHARSPIYGQYASQFGDVNTQGAQIDQNMLNQLLSMYGQFASQGAFSIDKNFDNMNLSDTPLSPTTPKTPWSPMQFTGRG